ncbi:FecR family protein [Pseudobacter ginsenosidimutans]|uniref:FecR family protein n=1 Tax=Pseudobacter ginsenosidimutans TaxID=661488 RepID=A0A4Q7N3J6_9BACT|nr:FecR family protein [Pseudobacter ginsenosidimutans]QEC43808.1 FecR family protein [Pseudobacter ginsenosidimutans]RZS75228.1 FecR family protein [Pseudobacter ginsenosidimutans]
MKSTAPFIAQLIIKKVLGEISQEEENLLEQWRSISPENEAKYKELINLHFIRTELSEYAEAEKIAAALKVPEVEPEEKALPVYQQEVRPVHFLQRWKWVAAIIIILGAGTYLYLHQNSKDKTSLDPGIATQQDLLPGSNKAVLTLSDGTKIDLNNAAQGQIAQQGNAFVEKSENGEIRYTMQGGNQDAGMINSMSTPKGGSYKLVLPDGSRVWLNAASSISYPVVFGKMERKVKVSGEVFLEVVKDNQKPFMVDVNRQSLIQVLGTSFNINAYENEDSITTTLVEGSVRITATNNKNANNQSGQPVTLRPGQQASQHNDAKISVHAANIDQVLAWKNGLFNMEGLSMKGFTKQLERWYDIQVQFEGKVPTVTFRGQMNRDVPLSDIISYLNSLHIKTRIDGKILFLKGS